MKPTMYIVAFDPYKSDAGAMHKLITTMPHTVDWSHYIGSAYLFRSNSNAATLENYINNHWVGNFIISPIDPENTGGWLPKDAWDWVNSRK